MKVSINWAQQVSNVDLKSIPTGTLLQKIGEQLAAVEDITDWGSRYDGVVVAKVISHQKHPNADKLNLCLIDDGGVTKGVERNEQGLVQIVCGASNIEDGMTVAWITPGATVPNTLDKDPFVLEVREIRGIPSPGMLATPHELGLNDDHSGLLVIDKADCQPGTPFKDLYQLDDVVIDCENKMFTHRPDCFGVLGVARELAGITGQVFKSPGWYADKPVFEKTPITLPVKIFNEVPDLVPRMMAVVLTNVTIAPSPMWLQVALTRVGIKSINNVVDITNFVMHLTGQPMHAFDYHKILERSSGDAAILGSRMAHANEPLTVLGGKKLTLTKEDIVLATDKEPADLAGIIGGGETEVDASTTTVLLTCATFDMYAVRRSSMRHGIFTDAAGRNTKGQSPLQNDRILAYAMAHIAKLAGGVQDGEVIDLKSYDQRVFNEETIHKPVTTRAEFINQRLGLQLTAQEITSLLTNVEFTVEQSGENLTIQAPFWRTDIEIPEDLVEEVGRLYGYDKLPRELPARSLAATPKNPLLELRLRIRASLSRAGANETLNYSFVHGNLLTKVGHDPAHAFQLSNALSPDLQYYRLSLTPSLLDKVHANIKAGFEAFALFELGKAHIVSQQNDEGLPKEFERLACVVARKTSPTSTSDAAFYEAKRYLTTLLDSLAISTPVKYLPIDDTDDDVASTYYASGRAAKIMVGDTLLGRIGEYHTAARQALKLPLYCAGFEISLEALQQLFASTSSNYRPLSRFPKTEQDISLRLPTDTSYDTVYECLLTALQKAKPDDIVVQLEPLDIYQAKDTDHKNITFRIHAVSYERTLQTETVSGLLDQAAAAAHEALQAVRL